MTSTSSTSARLATAIPLRMRYLRRDARGYPVPVIVMWDRHGVPHFPVSDAAKVQQVIRKKACAICGKPLDGRGWFVGGPRCFLHPQGAFLDPPVHHDCATYAMQVCPYIAAPSYARRIDDAKVKPGALTPDTVIVQDDMPDDRPPFFMLAATTAWSTELGAGPSQRVLRAKAPWEGTECWRHGERVPDAEAQDLMLGVLRAIGLGGRA